jgi:hypothetical protein
MKARALIDGASFGPETMKAMWEAFNEAWARMAATFGNVPQEVEIARLRLAEAMLSVATEGNTNVAALKDRAIEVMAMNYRPRARRE